MTTSVSTDPSGPASATGSRPGGPNGWLVIGGVVTALVLAAGTLSVAGWLGYRSETENQTYRADVTEISIELDTGDLTLVPGEPGAVAVTRRISWSYQRPDIDERWDGQTLRVTGTCGMWLWTGPNCGVDYTLEVPAGVAVRARTSTGDITISDIGGGPLHLTTSTGDIRVTGADGDLELHSSTGDVVASGITSDAVNASTGTGDVRLTLSTAPRTIVAHTTTGDVHIVVPDGPAYRVEADTNTGDTRVTVQRNDTSGRSIVARTSTGDVNVRYG